MNFTQQELDSNLLKAANSGRLTAVVKWLESGADIDCRNRTDGFTALILASKNGHMDIVGFLVDHGANINKVGKRAITALMVAAENGHLDVVKYLVEKGANIHAVGLYNYTALDYAILKKEKPVEEFLKSWIEQRILDKKITQQSIEQGLLF